MEIANDEKNIMANTANKGQKFVEKGSYVKSGTTIMKAEPFAVVLFSKYRGARCDTCFKSCNVSKCSGCQYVYYCGRNCQRKAWSVHKVECSILKRWSPNPQWEGVQLMARIIIKLQNGGDEERGYYGYNEYRTFGDLMSHATNISKDSERFDRFLSLCVRLQYYLPQEILPNEHELLTIYGRMTINSFDIVYPNSKAIGMGVYLGPSIIDHSCKPNLTHFFNGTTIVLRTLRDIPSFDWTKVSICYIDNFKFVDQRQEALRHYYFQCGCDRCKNPDPVETAAACPNKSCTNPCFPDDLACSKCGQKFPPDFKDNFEMIKSRSLRYLDGMEEEPLLENVRACLAEQEGLLHPLNLLHVRTFQAADIYLKFNSLHEIELYLKKLLQIYEYFFGDTHPMIPYINITLGSLQSSGKEFKLLADTVNKNMDILKRECGENHPELLSRLLGVFRKLDI